MFSLWTPFSFTNIFCSFSNNFCSIWNKLCSRTFFAPLETFFAFDSTPRTTKKTRRTIKLLYGPLSIARGPKSPYIVILCWPVGQNQGLLMKMSDIELMFTKRAFTCIVCLLLCSSLLFNALSKYWVWVVVTRPWRHGGRAARPQKPWLHIINAKKAATKYRAFDIKWA